MANALFPARIKTLEEELGGTLIRHGRSADLTPLGSECLPLVLKALAALEAIHDKVSTSQWPSRVLMTIAASPITASHLLPQWIAQWPVARRCDVHIVVCHSPMVARMVAEGGANVGFGFDIDSQNRPLHIQSLGVDPLLCVISGTWPISDDPIQILQQKPFIAGPFEQPLWAHLRRLLFAGLCLPRKPWIEVEDLDSARGMVLMGMGWSILPSSLIADDVRRQRLKVIADCPWKLPVRHSVCVWRTDQEAPFSQHTLKAWQSMLS